MSSATRRQRERRERRSAILDAADRVFQARGFDQVTMDDVAAEAELSKGTLYLYFKSKDDLFTALCTRFISDVVVRLEELSRGEATGIAAIRVMLAAFADFIAGHPQHFRLIMGRLLSGNMPADNTPSFAAHRAQIARIVSAIITAIERGKGDGTIRPELDAAQTSAQLWGTLIGTMIIRINSAELGRRFPRPVDFDKFVDGFIQLVCHGLQPADWGSTS